jgi:hypothetical protein
VATCLGTPDHHCCWFAGKVCPLYDPDATPGRNCTARAELGSWDAVDRDPRWQAEVRDGVGAVWFAKHPGTSCGDFPEPGQTCWTCGVKG